MKRQALLGFFALHAGIFFGGQAYAESALRCRETGGGAELIRTADGARMGNVIASLSLCDAAIAAAKSGVVCARKENGDKGWMAMHVERRHWIGRYPLLSADCFEATRHAGHGVVCSHTGLTLDQGKPGFKPTNIDKANDAGFMGSSAWLDFCKVATDNSRDGKVCANGNGGTGNHAQWYLHEIATGSLAEPTHSGTVQVCSAFKDDNKTPGSGFVNLLPPSQVETYRQALPYLEDAALEQAIKDSQTMWYDDKAIVPAYQDSMGDPKGLRPNTIASEFINLAVPGGWQRLFQTRGRFNFPFATGGADLSKNFTKVNFWIPPRVNGRVLPVAYWKLNFSRWRWLFPVGTKFGEVMMVNYPDGDTRVFEIRVRTRQQDKWHNEIFRPFLSSGELADMIKSFRPGWQESPALVNAVARLNDSNNLTTRSLSTQFFKGTFETVNGHADEVPDFGDDSLAKDLLSYSTFRSVKSTPWKVSGSKVAFAATTRSNASIVPSSYDGGMLPVNDTSCLRCHIDGGRQIENFYPEMVLYGELWGEDETFSWHPFETSAFHAPNGDIINFNNDNRRIRSEFVSAGLVETYQSSLHPDSLYRALPRPWTYNPVRASERAARGLMDYVNAFTSKQ